MHDRPPVHLIVPTHTTRSLDICLAGIARQTAPPATITVTCDVDDPAITDLVLQCVDRFGLSVRYVRRAHGGTERLAQVRNNAVRALIDDGFSEGRLLFLDGDTWAPPRTVELHALRGAEVDMALPGRVHLDEARTAALDADAIVGGRQTIELTPDDRRSLERQHRRAQAHRWLRALRLTKAHKPRLLGGHHSVSFAAYLRVNGHDEEYHTWGTEDDDFARRVYRSGGRSRILVRDIPVVHLYHPTRATGRWGDRDNARRFARADLPLVCAHGVRNPWPQAPVAVDWFEPAAARSAAPEASESTAKR